MFLNPIRPIFYGDKLMKTKSHIHSLIELYDEYQATNDIDTQEDIRWEIMNVISGIRDAVLQQEEN